MLDGMIKIYILWRNKIIDNVVQLFSSSIEVYPFEKSDESKSDPVWSSMAWLACFIFGLLFWGVIGTILFKFIT